MLDFQQFAKPLGSVPLWSLARRANRRGLNGIQSCSNLARAHLIVLKPTPMIGVDLWGALWSCLRAQLIMASTQLRHSFVPSVAPCGGKYIAMSVKSYVGPFHLVANTLPARSGGPVSSTLRCLPRTRDFRTSTDTPALLLLYFAFVQPACNAW